MCTLRALTFSFLGIAALGRPLIAQVTLRVSLDPTGGQANNDSFASATSADGRYCAFESAATNLVLGDTNSVMDIFVRDRLAGTTERVSVDSNGVQANGYSFFPSISADGRYVAFQSTATNLVPGDTNGHYDIFVHDRQSGSTEIVSLDSSGNLGNGHSFSASISADGRFVAFESEASNLVPGDTNGVSDVFVRDRQTATTERVSVDSSGAEGDTDSYNPSITGDGRFVAFESAATNLVPGDGNGWMDVFVRDRQNSTTERVSVDSGGAESDFDCINASITDDGRYVAFESMATNLVLGDTNGWNDIFIHDRQSGTTVRVSLDSSGAESDSDSISAAISADGRFVAFQSDATNLVPGDTNGWSDVFLRDLQAGTTERLSVDSAGIQGNFGSYSPAISADGSFVFFESDATNLVPADSNVKSDIFARDRDETAFTSLCDPGQDGVLSCPCGNPPSGLGRGCNNSAGTGGAVLSASGVSYLSLDSLVFTTSGERATATSILLQGTSSPAAGLTYGQGVRCVGGNLKRLFVKPASGGSITAPNFGAGDPPVSVRSAAKGDVIQAGESRWYLVYYRDPTVLGGCPGSSTFNATQSGRIDWSL